VSLSDHGRDAHATLRRDEHAALSFGDVTSHGSDGASPYRLGWTLSRTESPCYIAFSEIDFHFQVTRSSIQVSV